MERRNKRFLWIVSFPLKPHGLIFWEVTQYMSHRATERSMNLVLLLQVLLLPLLQRCENDERSSEREIPGNSL